MKKKKNMEKKKSGKEMDGGLLNTRHDKSTSEKTGWDRKFIWSTCMYVLYIYLRFSGLLKFLHTYYCHGVSLY